MSSKITKSINLRMMLVGIFFALLFGVVGARAVSLQVIKSDTLSQMAAGQYKRSSVFRGKRGTIYDRNQVEMAVSIDAESIAVYPPQIENKPVVVKALANALQINPQTLNKKLRSGRAFVWVKRQVTPKEIDAVKRLKIERIDFIPEHTRYYPNKMLAAQVIGFTGIDGRGLEGIEFYYDTHLKGRALESIVLKDALGRGFEAQRNLISNPSGHNLILTIDRTIQYITEKILAQTVNAFSAKSGMAVVMAPRTGAILALAHYPDFNPNTFLTYSREHWRNRAITDPFEPGSTMKIFTAAAALESGAATPQSVFFGENGEYQIGKNTIHDTRPHKQLTLFEVVKYSSNIGAVKVGQKTGSKNMYQTLQRFGFGAKTGLDCPGETAGTLFHYSRWSKMDAAAIAFGHGISVSAIQLVTAAAAIANDGVLMKPHIVQMITDQNGRPVKIFKPTRVRRAVSVDTAQKVKKMMEAVTRKGGTGVRAALSGYSVGGKTGTAQKTDENGNYAEDKFTASFIGFAPTENPEVVILVVVDEPQGQYYGSQVAAPAFKSIAHETLTYMNIPPTAAAENLFVQFAEAQKG